MVVTDERPTQDVRVIPAYLAFERMNGEALPYKGYLDVLAGNKKPEEIMGSSSLQAALVAFITGFLFSAIDRKKYLLATNESGLHLDSKNNLANDIAIFLKADVQLNNKYFRTAPKIVIEVDIKVELTETSWNSEMSYILEKSQKMIDFGVEKLIWISTHNRKIFIITPHENWYFVDFNQDVQILDGCILNVAQLLTDEGIEY